MCGLLGRGRRRRLSCQDRRRRRLSYAVYCVCVCVQVPDVLDTLNSWSHHCWSSKYEKQRKNYSKDQRN